MQCQFPERKPPNFAACEFVHLSQQDQFEWAEKNFTGVIKRLMKQQKNQKARIKVLPLSMTQYLREGKNAISDELSEEKKRDP